MSLLSRFLPKKILHPRLVRPGYVGRHKGRVGLVIATGPSILTHRGVIEGVRETHAPIVIGAQGPFVGWGCDYIVFNNRRRFCTYGTEASAHANHGLLVAPYIPPRLVRRVCPGPWESMPFVNDNAAPFAIRDGVILSGCGQTGAIAIAVAHVMGLAPIFVAGLDGYTDADHWHAFGGTEGKSRENFEKCVALSAIVRRVLGEMRAAGVPFSIVTPTAYTEYQHA